MVAGAPLALDLVGNEESSKRRQILNGARKVFMDLGFDGASMGEIARSAGVSKGTLYVYFADKSRLFEAIVEEEALEKGQVEFNLSSERDAAITLLEGLLARAGSEPGARSRCTASPRRSPFSASGEPSATTRPWSTMARRSASRSASSM